jgi:hypothetical protein
MMCQKEGSTSDDVVAFVYRSTQGADLKQALRYILTSNYFDLGVGDKETLSLSGAKLQVLDTD